MNDIRKIEEAQVKQLRKDAIRLETVAKHLRLQAHAIAARLRSDLLRGRAQANFFAKKSNIDPDLPLIPTVEDFTEDKNNG